MKKYLILSLLVLTGCATEQVSKFEPYAPKAEIKSQFAYVVDLANCRNYALDYLNNKSSLDPLSVAGSAAQGSLSNLTTSITTVGVSGGGYAVSEALNELGLNSDTGKKVVAICMHDKGQASGMYHIYDPIL